MQRLREIIDPTPDEQPERPGIGPFCTVDDPIRAFGPLTETLRAGGVESALLADMAQVFRGGIAGRMSAQVGIVASIDFDEVEQMLLAVARGTPGRGDHAFEMDRIGVEKQMNQRLKVVEIGAADIGRHHDAGTRCAFGERLS